MAKSVDSIQARNVAIVVGAVVVVILLLGLLGGGMMWPGMMGGSWGGFGWWGISMGIAMLLFWALIVGGLVLLVTWLVRQGQSQWVGPSRETPTDILRQRYAKGEITREQYEQMRRDVES